MQKLKVFNLSLVVLILGLFGCIGHILVDTDSRVQVINETPWQIHTFQIFTGDSTSGSHILLKDTLGAGEKSLVQEVNYFGKFNLAIQSIRDTNCVNDCSVLSPVGRFELAGSSVFRVKSLNDSLWVED